MSKSNGYRGFATLGWGVVLGLMLAPAGGRAGEDAVVKTAESQASSTAQDSPAQEAGTFLDSTLRRIPYIGRLFAQPIPAWVEGAGPHCCLDGSAEEFVERIGVDFDFAFEGPQTSRGIRVVVLEDDVAGIVIPHVLGSTVASQNTGTCPHSARSTCTGARCPQASCPQATCPEAKCGDMEFEVAIAGSKGVPNRREELALVEQLLRQEFTEADCGIDQEFTLNSSQEDATLREKLAAVSAQATILAHLSEIQTELVEARMEMVEKLVESKMEHLEQVTQLTIENERLKAQLEFQKERETLQAKIAELTAKNEQDRIVAELNTRLTMAQLQTEVHLHLANEQVVRSQARIQELERRLAPVAEDQACEEIARQPRSATAPRTQY